MTLHSDRFNVPILIIHHLKKAMAEDWVNEVSGSTGIAGAADTILVLKRVASITAAFFTALAGTLKKKNLLCALTGMDGCFRATLNNSPCRIGNDRYSITSRNMVKVLQKIWSRPSHKTLLRLGRTFYA